MADKENAFDVVVDARDALGVDPDGVCPVRLLTNVLVAYMEASRELAKYDPAKAIEIGQRASAAVDLLKVMLDHG